MIYKGMLLAMFLVLSSSASNAAPTNKQIYISVSSEDTILDGTPGEFDIKQFTARLNKSLVKKLDDQGYAFDTENHAHIIKVDIDSVAHKLRPFHFKSQYIIKYVYKLTGTDKKKLIILKNNQVNEDQIDLIDEVTEDIVNNMVKNMVLN